MNRDAGLQETAPVKVKVLISAVFLRVVCFCTGSPWMPLFTADVDPLKPNSITLAGSELAPNRFGASSELVRAEIWPII